MQYCSNRQDVIQRWDIVVPSSAWNRGILGRAMQAGEQFLAENSGDGGGGGGDFVVDCVEEDEIEFDVQTQRRLDAAVDKLLKGYDWTLAPLANKYALHVLLRF